MGCRAPAQGTDTECAGARLHERMAPSHCSSLYSPGHNQSSLSLGAGMAAYSLGMWPKSALSRGICLTCPAMQNWKHSRAWALAELGFRCGAGQPRSAQPLGRRLDTPCHVESAAHPPNAPSLMTLRIHFCQLWLWGTRSRDAAPGTAWDTQAGGPWCATGPPEQLAL